MSPEHPRSHPFLLVRAGDYAELQGRAVRAPWAQMRARAIAEAGGCEGSDAVHFPVHAPVRTRNTELGRIMSTTALAYVLDPAHRPAYKARFLAHARYWDLTVEGNVSGELIAAGDDDPTAWSACTPAGGAFFNTVLALDILHDDLEPAELAGVEAVLEAGPGRFFYRNATLWKSSGYAARGIWALYRGDRSMIESAKRDYLAEIKECITADGVFIEGPGYAAARWGEPSREQKQFFGDVLAFTGEHPGWYADRQLRAFQEWLHGYARGPARIAWAFGDTAPGRFTEHNDGLRPATDGGHVFNDSSGSERAFRFSREAGHYAAWEREHQLPAARLCSYVLSAPAARGDVPRIAPSRLFPDGGAFFREARDHPAALAGVLWNTRSARGHNHKETNALNLAGYGVLLLRNAGYAGWGTGAHGFSWDYINHRAVSGNVVLVDYAVRDEFNPSAVNDHVRKTGGGVGGFVTGVVDYASGESAGALPNARHTRNFLLVHSQPGRPGYFVTLDEIVAQPGSRLGHTVWHPNTAEVAEVVRDLDYACAITDGAGAVRLNVCLATPPEATTVHRGLLANWGGGRVGTYLFCSYALDAQARRQVVTVLYPHDDVHPKALFERLAGEGYSGARLAFKDGAVDVAIESDEARPVEPMPGVSVQARASLHRVSEGRLEFLFVREGRAFLRDGVGFVSTGQLSLFLQGSTATISSPGGPVRFCRDGLRAVSLAGVPLPASAVGDGFLDVDVPAGLHELALTVS